MSSNKSVQSVAEAKSSLGRRHVVGLWSQLVAERCRWGSLGLRSKVGPGQPMFESKNRSKRRRLWQLLVGCTGCKCVQGTGQSGTPSLLLQGSNRPLPAATLVRMDLVWTFGAWTINPHLYHLHVFAHCPHIRQYYLVTMLC